MAGKYRKCDKVLSHSLCMDALNLLSSAATEWPDKCAFHHAKGAEAKNRGTDSISLYVTWQSASTRAGVSITFKQGSIPKAGNLDIAGF